MVQDPLTCPRQTNKPSGAPEAPVKKVKARPDLRLGGLFTEFLNFRAHSVSHMYLQETGRALNILSKIDFV